jgi:hypothetical protein
MNANKSLIEQFFGVIAHSQTWLNYLYLFLAFPLGLFYFIYLTVGLSVGIGTLIIWVGFLILGVVIAGWWLMAGLERSLAVSLLKVEIPPMSTPRSEKAMTSTERLGAFIANPVTWKGFAFLLVKFPLGIISFVVLATLTAVTLILLASPVIYPYLQPEVWVTNTIVWRIDTIGEAAGAFVVGILLLFISLNIFNGLAWVSGQFARVMLGNPRKEAVQPITVVPVVPPEPAVPAAEGLPPAAEFAENPPDSNQPPDLP